LPLRHPAHRPLRRRQLPPMVPAARPRLARLASARLARPRRRLPLARHAPRRLARGARLRRAHHAGQALVPRRDPQAVRAHGVAAVALVGPRLSPLTRRRLHNFRANRRGYWSLWIFLVMFVASLGADLVANDRPLVVRYAGRFYVPVLSTYPETTFGGVFPTEA